MYDFIAVGRFFGHFLVPILLFLGSCDHQKSTLPITIPKTLSQYEVKILQLPQGKKLYTFIAQSAGQQAQGLSGLKGEEFATNFAMFFPGKADMPRTFWMPDTYFDLDIFFLDKNLRVIDMQRNVPHHPGRQEPPTITRTKSVHSRHVLEIKSSSPLAKEIRIGQQLKFINP